MSAIAILLNHVVGERQQRRRNIYAEHLRRFEIDYEIDFRRLHHRQIARLFAFEYAPSIDAQLQALSPCAHIYLALTGHTTAAHRL